MQLKNYYELMKQSESYLENIQYSIDAFSHYLKDNKKVSEFYRSNGKNFLAGFKLLVKCSLSDTSDEDKLNNAYALKKYMESTNNLWLISKMKELL